MLETVDLEQNLRKSAYKKQRPRLQQRLYALQIACRDAGIPVIIVFEGWDAAGKDAAMKLMTQKLDPRSFTIHDIQPPRTYETYMPWLWRFWLKIPRYGEMAVFYHSWYERVLTGRVETRLPKQDLHRAYRDIGNFERALADDGYVIIKLFFHSSQEEQARRLNALQSDPLSNWRVRPEHWERHNKYDQFVAAIEEMLKRTNTPTAPWDISPATDAWGARIAVCEAVIRRIEEALQARGQALPPDTYIEEEPFLEDEEA